MDTKIKLKSSVKPALNLIIPHFLQHYPLFRTFFCILFNILHFNNFPHFSFTPPIIGIRQTLINYTSLENSTNALCTCYQLQSILYVLPNVKL